MEEKERLHFIDGIKAAATVMVFNIHFLNAYYCGIYTLNPENFHTKSGLEWFIGATPLNIVYAGKAGARIFLGVSAFLLARRYFLSREEERGGLLSRVSIKKYFRLASPILAVNLFAAGLMYLGCYGNGKAAALAGSTEFFGSYNQFVPSFWAAIREALYGCFVNGSNAYNGPLWFICYEFWGCLLVAAILALFGSGRGRYVVYIVAAALLVRTDFLVMILCMAAADLIYTKKSLMNRFATQKWLMWLLLLVSFYFLTYPSYGANLENTIYRVFPPKVLFYYNGAIPVLLVSVYYLEPVKHILSLRILGKFQRISYGFYLLHFPILCTLSTAFFNAMFGRMNYHVLVLLTYILTFTVSAMLAWVLTKTVDRPGGRMAEWITCKLAGRGSGF